VILAVLGVISLPALGVFLGLTQELLLVLTASGRA
jgi:hypothetical protein